MIGVLRIINITENKYAGIWNWEEEQDYVTQDFNIIESGICNLNNKEFRWNLVSSNDSFSMNSLFLTSLDTLNKRFFTINMSSEIVEDYKIRICEMESIIESFEINRNNSW